MENLEFKKTYQFLLSNRIKSITGIALNRNKNLTVIINNPVDYVIDGIIYINSNKIKEIIFKEQNLEEKIVNSKFTVCLERDERYLDLDFKDFNDLFTQLKKINTFCELSLSKENVVFIGKIVNVEKDSIDVDFYDTNLKLMDNALVKYKDITTVTIFSDYADTISNVILKNIIID